MLLDSESMYVSTITCGVNCRLWYARVLLVRYHTTLVRECLHFWRPAERLSAKLQSAGTGMSRIGEQAITTYQASVTIRMPVGRSTLEDEPRVVSGYKAMLIGQRLRRARARHQPNSHRLFHDLLEDPDKSSSQRYSLDTSVGSRAERIHVFRRCDVHTCASQILYHVNVSNVYDPHLLGRCIDTAVVDLAITMSSTSGYKAILRHE